MLIHRRLFGRYDHTLFTPNHHYHDYLSFPRLNKIRVAYSSRYFCIRDLVVYFSDLVFFHVIHVSVQSFLVIYRSVLVVVFQMKIDSFQSLRFSAPSSVVFLPPRSFKKNRFSNSEKSGSFVVSHASQKLSTHIVTGRWEFGMFFLL